MTLLNLGAWFSGRVDAPVCPSHRLVFRTPEDAPLLCQQRVLARNGNSCALPSATLARWEAYGKRRSENSVGRVGTNCSALADPYPDCLDALGHAACAMTRALRPAAALCSRLLERNGQVHYKFLILCLMVRGVRHERLGRKIQSDHAKSIAVQSDGRAMP